MLFSRRVSADVAESFDADKKLALTYPDLLTEAEETEQALRRSTDPAEQRVLAGTLDARLLAAIKAGEAAERVVMGTKTYEPADGKGARAAQIARRKARATWKVKPYTDEVDRLRTAREAHKLSYRALSRP